MSSPFQTALKDRAAERAREWEAARDASVGLAEATAAVRSRRRGRGVLAAAGCVAAGVALAAVTYGLLGAGSARETAMPAGGKQAIDALAAVGADDVVLTLWEERPAPGPYAPRRARWLCLAADG
jgi:hypothetical protein